MKCRAYIWTCQVARVREGERESGVEVRIRVYNARAAPGKSSLKFRAPTRGPRTPASERKKEKERKKREVVGRVSGIARDSSPSSGKFGSFYGSIFSPSLLALSSAFFTSLFYLLLLPSRAPLCTGIPLVEYLYVCAPSFYCN